MNATLSGLEHAVKSVVSKQDKINISIYADDFIITGASRTVLEQKVKPAVENFLKVRGLELSAEKSKISTLQEGFDFLGFNVRKYGDKLFIMPARKSVQRFLDNIRELVRKNRATSTAELIAQLNPRIRGWANYYRHGVAKSTYSYVDTHLVRASKTSIKRHVKIRGDASPYDPAYREYFAKHALCQKITLRETRSDNWP